MIEISNLDSTNVQVVNIQHFCEVIGKYIIKDITYTDGGFMQVFQYCPYCGEKL